MRIAINASSLLSPATGIASYTRNLAHALLNSGEVEAFFFYAMGWSRNLRETSLPAVQPLKNVIKKLVPHPYEISRFLQKRRFCAGMARYRPDIYHEPNYLAFPFDGPLVLTVHDLSHIRYPETHPAGRVKAMNKYVPLSVERAAQIITDSEFVKREIVKHFRVSPAKVHAIHLGVGGHYVPRSAEQTAAALKAHGLAYRNYIFAVGTLEPRKNLIQAINAHSGLPQAARKRMPLVIAGMKGWLTRELDARIRVAEERGEVRWLGYVSAADLPLLYSGARLFVYPSLYEGFGLPVLEAMASGVPVITSDQASLPEVAGDAAIMVDPHDFAGLRDAMLRMIEDEEETGRRAKLGRIQAARFTWQACAEKTLAVYRQAIATAGKT